MEAFTYKQVVAFVVCLSFVAACLYLESRRDREDQDSYGFGRRSVQSKLRNSRAASICDVGQWRCPIKNEFLGAQLCIKPCQKCDGIVDCPMATDELNCPCRSKLKTKFICDGRIDCMDYSDELGCEDCLNDELMCGSECVSLASFCGGTNCKGFSRSLLCSRLVQTKGEATTLPYRSKGFLRMLVRNKWLSVCGSSSTELEVTVNEHCEAVTGVGSEDNFYKLEDGSSTTDSSWASVETSENISTAIETDTCPQNIVVYVECILPTCQRSSNRSDENSLRLERIVGGKDAPEEVWSSLVRIIKDSEHHCGGSVVTPRWILSASHCFAKITGFMYELESGTSRRGSYGPNVQRVIISHVIRHPDFDPYTMENDIALVRLRTPLQFNRWTRPACFSDANAVIPIGITCQLAGWGFEEETGSLADTLQEVDMPILENNVCSKEFIFINHQKVLCAGYEEGGRDACQGDSGGPMMCHQCQFKDAKISCDVKNWYQAAVVSYGRGCARSRIPGVYTKVEYFRKWISETIQKLENNFTQLPEKVPKTLCDGLVCANPSGLCLTSHFVCDGKVHCLNAADEINCKNDSSPVQDDSYDEQNKTNYEDENYDYEYEYSTFDDGTKSNVTTTKDFCLDNYYECEVHQGCIPNRLLCDETYNCRDGTDELRCTCVDRLFLIQRERVCDGVYDCFDFTDEPCALCKVGDWLCSRSGRRCISGEKRCDGKVDCQYGEDELNCLALTPYEGEVVVDGEENPLLSRQGHLLLFSNFVSWDPVCEHEMTQGVATDICSYLGFGSPINISYDSNLPIKYEVRDHFALQKRVAQKNLRRRRSVDYYRQVNRQNSNDLEMGMENIVSVISPINRFNVNAENARSKRMACNQVHITCGERLCGRVSSLHFSKSPPIHDASHVPWAMSIFRDGEYLCGGTLIDFQWVISSTICVGRKNPSEELHVLGGPQTLMGSVNYLGPKDVNIKVDWIYEIEDTDLLLLHLEKSTEHEDQINVICLDENAASTTWKECVMAGRHQSDISRGFLLIPRPAVNCSEGEMCFQTYFPENVCTNSWAGLIACREERNNDSPWTATAIWNGDTGESCQKPPLSHFILTSDFITKVKNIIDKNEATQNQSVNFCDGHKCPLGKCIPLDEVCNARVSCPDLSDEPFECPSILNLCRNSSLSKSCECRPGELKCSDDVCITSDKICDGIADCIDGEDEEKCQCSMLNFNSKEVKLCDGLVDCTDETDELYCNCDTKTEYRCFRSPNQSCIRKDLVCDNVPDCAQDEDEAFCITLAETLSPEEDVLGVPEVSIKGFFLLRVNGIWHTYNNPHWNESSSDAVCDSLGHSGAQNTTFKRLDFDSLDEEGRSVRPIRIESRQSVTMEDSVHDVLYIHCAWPDI